MISSLDKQAKKRFIAIYDDAFGKFGLDDARSLGWSSNFNQKIRFKVLKEVGNFNSRSVLDVGCGLGYFYQSLRDCSFKDFSYTGIDISKKLIRGAKKKYPETQFKALDFADFKGEKYDFVVASGALSVTVPDYKNFYFEYIRKMFEHSKIAVAFNMLDGRFHITDETYATYMIPEVYRFCSTLTRRIIIRQDYLDQDFTFYLYKNIYEKEA
jgi:trans-aconitate methyltransferase